MSKVKVLLDKLAVENEPGLSNAQLMLLNHDLRPGEMPICFLVFNFFNLKRLKLTLNFSSTVDPERRQWKWYNFIAFWVADSLNIVRLPSQWVVWFVFTTVGLIVFDPRTPG